MGFIRSLFNSFSEHEDRMAAIAKVMDSTEKIIKSLAFDKSNLKEFYTESKNNLTQMKNESVDEEGYRKEVLENVTILFLSEILIKTQFEKFVDNDHFLRTYQVAPFIEQVISTVITDDKLSTHYHDMHYRLGGYTSDLPTYTKALESYFTYLFMAINMYQVYFEHIPLDSNHRALITYPTLDGEFVTRVVSGDIDKAVLSSLKNYEHGFELPELLPLN